MFDRLSNLITRRPRAIVAIWVIILIVSVPLALSLDGRLHYDIASFVPKDLESTKANGLYTQQFPNASQCQIIVAVQSDNRTQAMLFIRALNDTVAADGRIKNASGTTSIYDIQRRALSDMAPQLHDGLYELYDNASDISTRLYDARDQVANGSRDMYNLWDTVTNISGQMDASYGQITGISSQLYAARDQVAAADSGLFQIKDAADLVYGIPAYYAQAWAQVRPAMPNDAAADVQAKQLTLQHAVSPIPDPDNRALASAYLDNFNGTWAAILTASPAAAGDPMGTAQQAIDAMAGPFFNAAVPAGQQRQVLTDLLALKLAGYGNGHTASLESYVIDHAMAYQGLGSPDDRTKLTAIYEQLGENPSAAAIDAFTLNMATAGMPDSDASAARAVYALGRNPPEDAVGQYIIAQASVGRNDTERQIISDAWRLHRSTERDFDNYTIQKASEGKNASETAQIKEIYALGRNPANGTLDQYVLNKAYEGHNTTECQVIREVYELGRNPGQDALENYAITKAADTLNITGNLSFFHAVMGLSPNGDKSDIRALADDWAYTHDYTNPQLFSDTIENGLASGDITLYAVMMAEPEASTISHNAAMAVRDDAGNLTSGYPGLKAYVTGMSAIGVDSQTAAETDVSNIDKISVALILLILGVYFMSILTPFVPLLVIGAAIVTGFGALYLSSYTVDLYFLTKTFMIVVMLGAGTDYCVFILSRYAEERRIGKGVDESVRYAIRHAGESILCSGLTAMIGFASLALIDNSLFRSIGQSMALAILASMLVAMTLIPAILVLTGDRIFWPRKIYNTGQKASRLGSAMKAITRGVIKHSGVVLAITILMAVPAVWLCTQLQPGMDIVSMLPDNIESKVGYNLLQHSFGSGNIDQAKIIVTLPGPMKGADGNYSASALARIDDISSIAASVQGVDKVYSMTRPDGVTINYDDLYSYPQLEQTYYRTMMDNETGADGRTTVISVAFQGSPYSAESNKAVDTIREKLAAYSTGEGVGTTVLMGGNGVGSYDFQKMATDRFPLVIALVFVGIFAVLAALLRSAITPVKLFVSMLMGIVWTLAAFTVVFQMWLGDSVIWILPITLFCTLMGMGGDYCVFMMSRVHEEVEKGASDEEAILRSVEATGPVILLCGLVMAAAFGSMMISGMAELKEFGFVLSLAIILDATLMVLVLIPSIMMVARKYNWWLPGKKKAVLAAPVQEEKV